MPPSMTCSYGKRSGMYLDGKLLNDANGGYSLGSIWLKM